VLADHLSACLSSLAFAVVRNDILTATGRNSMPKIDIAHLETDQSTGYPEPYRQAVMGRIRKRLGNAAGLDQFGVNLTTLKPGAASAQRHWHAAEDELIYMLSGEVVLCEEDGETVLRAGDVAGFKAGVANGHCLINRSGEDALFLEIGTRSVNERVEYPDIDMRATRDEKGTRYLHRSGEPW
jgi:uncharacterized cupin superfamily protein